MVDIILNEKQACEFARAIFADIDDYVNDHLREFEEFLKFEEGEVEI